MRCLGHLTWRPERVTLGGVEVDVTGAGGDIESVIEGGESGIVEMSMCAGLRRSRETTSSRSLSCKVKCLSLRFSTLYGPS